MPCASCSPGRSNLRRSQRNAVKKAPSPTSASALDIRQNSSPEECDRTSPEHESHDDDLAAAATHAGETGSACGPTADIFHYVGPSTSTNPFGAATGTGITHNHHPPYYLRRKSLHFENEPMSTTLRARKRTRRADPHSRLEDSAKKEPAAQHQLHTLPDDVLITIFSYLSEKDLCRISQVCKRFQILGDDLELWRKLYQCLFEYDLPLFHPEPCRFEFESVSESELVNPWRESFQQLYRGVHVRPGYRSWTFPERKMPFFDTIESALEYVDKNSDRLSTADGDGPLVFIHSGTYNEEFIVIDCDISIIGAAPGIVSHSVILDRNNETTLMFVEGAKRAYAGHMTLKFSSGGPFGPPIGQMAPVLPVEPIGPPEAMVPMEPMLPMPMGPMGHLPSNNKHCCIEINENCSPVIDSCLIWSNSSVGAAVCVTGIGANPTIKRCDISHCANVGLCVTDYAQGIYENNEICNNFLAGVLVKNGANPIMRRNHIHHGRDVGILAFDNGMGYFDNNDIHSNCNAAIEIKGGANPTVVNCEIHHGHKWGIYVHGSGRGQFMYNKIHSFNFAGVWITSTRNPTIRRNEIYNCRQGGVYIYEGRALVEYNNIYGDALPGIQITSTGHPIIRYNNIYRNF